MANSALPISHPDLPLTTQGKRICQLIALDPSRLDEYKAAHQDVFPGVLAALRAAHIFGGSLFWTLGRSKRATRSMGSGQSWDEASSRRKSTSQLRLILVAALCTPTSAGTGSTTDRVLTRSLFDYADYSIHLFTLPISPNPLLVAHMRYCGSDFERDMAVARQDAETHRWWALVSLPLLPPFLRASLKRTDIKMVRQMDPMQISYVPGAVGSAEGPGWWLNGEEVFRMES